MSFVSARFFFDTLGDAVEALLIVLEDARTTEKEYSFGSTSPQQILASGLLIHGDAEHLVKKIEELPGSESHTDF